MIGHGGRLLTIGLLVLLTINISRVVFQTEDDPVFLSEPAGLVWVELGEGFPNPAVHQIIDGLCWLDVIKMTDTDVSKSLSLSEQLRRHPVSGQRVDLIVKSSEIQEVRVTWMAAAKRIALGIPLHPDRMSESDWQVLPGIGVKMARRIEENRQKYGDFGSFSKLTRVSGLGNKRLSYWNQYFFNNESVRK